eukprot:3228875-Pyramimonas_sp.AAC.1
MLAGASSLDGRWSSGLGHPPSRLAPIDARSAPRPRGAPSERASSAAKAATPEKLRTIFALLG